MNVVQLGADRTGRTDASAQFQQAIDMLAPTGGTLYIPAGSYKIGQTLVWKNDETGVRPASCSSATGCIRRCC